MMKRRLKTFDTPGSDDERIGKEETLSNFTAFANPTATSSTRQTQTTLSRAGFLLDNVQ